MAAGLLLPMLQRRKFIVQCLWLSNLVTQSQFHMAGKEQVRAHWGNACHALHVLQPLDDASLLDADVCMQAAVYVVMSIDSDAHDGVVIKHHMYVQWHVYLCYIKLLALLHETY